MTTSKTSLSGGRLWLLVALVLLLTGLCLLILRPFLLPIIWATILAAATWKGFVRLRRLLRGSSTGAALIMTLVLGCAVVIPVVWLLELVQKELIVAYQFISQYLAQGSHPLPAALQNLPWVGEHLQAELDSYSADPTALARQLGSGALQWSSRLGSILGGVGHLFADLLFTLLMLFFLFRNGEEIMRQAGRITHGLFGDRLDDYVLTAVTMTRAVVQGMIATAIVQGALAGIGYRIVGLSAPVLLGVLTAVFSVVPLVGTALVWLPVALWLLSNGQGQHGVILLFYGGLIVYPADNVVRPMLIGSAAHVPFLAVLLGALGGLAAFGAIGVLVGPVLLAIGLALWREWVLRFGATGAG